ncbi:MAG: hypothetical protein JWN43_3044 [Gammaproteobacteria bacterium]|nr:hypothetical protein [Gammaproteobacteria bacterium]
MKVIAAALLALLAADGRAATAYVTDELVLGVYAEQTTQGERLTTLHSGASVETLAGSGDSTRVRLVDGTTGWVKTAYLTYREPATVRVKQLQAELDRSRATTPAVAEPRPVLASRMADQAARIAPGLWLSLAVICIALGCGFWLGYAMLAHRVKGKFGGLKVY